MGITVSEKTVFARAGRATLMMCKILFDSSYPANGEAVTPGDFGLSRIINITPGISENGYKFAFDPSADKIKAFYSGGDGVYRVSFVMDVVAARDFSIEMQNDYTLTKAEAVLDDCGTTSGATTIDVQVGGTTMLDSAMSIAHDATDGFGGQATATILSDGSEDIDATEELRVTVATTATDPRGLVVNLEFKARDSGAIEVQAGEDLSAEFFIAMVSGVGHPASDTI